MRKINRRQAFTAATAAAMTPVVAKVVEAKEPKEEPKKKVIGFGFHNGTIGPMSREDAEDQMEQFIERQNIQDKARMVLHEVGGFELKEIDSIRKDICKHRNLKEIENRFRENINIDDNKPAVYVNFKNGFAMLSQHHIMTTKIWCAIVMTFQTGHDGFIALGANKDEQCSWFIKDFRVPKYEPATNHIGEWS